MLSKRWVGLDDYGGGQVSFPEGVIEKMIVIRNWGLLVLVGQDLVCQLDDWCWRCSVLKMVSSPKNLNSKPVAEFWDGEERHFFVGALLF